MQLAFQGWRQQTKYILGSNTHLETMKPCRKGLTVTKSNCVYCSSQSSKKELSEKIMFG